MDGIGKRSRPWDFWDGIVEGEKPRKLDGVEKSRESQTLNRAAWMQEWDLSWQVALGGGMMPYILEIKMIFRPIILHFNFLFILAPLAFFYDVSML
ncbi:MAG: hypothetical protein KAW47_09735 [Thermoplasmatales archaeon]|nr:hypothetical protein [Thermoplasmatales archaeon]